MTKGDEENIRAEEFQAFLEHLQAYDMLGVVVVGALYIEEELQKLCKLHLFDPPALDLAELTFEQWVHLSISFGLTPKLKSPLKAFATVRNKYAHRLGFELTDKTVKDLIRAFDGEHRAYMHTSISKTNAKLGLDKGKKLQEFDLKTQMMMVVTTLRGALVTANRQAAELVSKTA